jgi:hypothetical protein
MNRPQVMSRAAKGSGPKCRALRDPMKKLMKLKEVVEIEVNWKIEEE